MFHNLAEDIAFLLIKNKIVDIEQHDVYVYGLEVFLLNSLLLLVFLAISLLLGSFIHFIAFFIFFFPLRSFAGGYHAKTSERCFVLSITMYVISLAVAKLLPLLYTSVYAIAVGIIFSVIIFIFAPLVNNKNTLNEDQTRRNKFIVRLILVIYYILFVLCYMLNLKIASSEIVFIGLACVLLVIGKVMDKLNLSADK